MAGGLRILLIDDEARILRALKALFRDYETFQTTNPLEAVSLAKQHDVDVVICDQRMPEKTGVDTLRDIKDAHPRALRVLLTGYSDLKAVVGSVNEGEVYRFVHKPWDNNELREIVGEAATTAQFVVVPRLVHETIDLAFVHRTDHGFQIRIAGEQHAQRARVGCLDVAQRIHAGFFRHALVADDDVDVMLLGE